MSNPRSTALTFLGLTTFVLLAVPRLSLKFGSVPIYAIDALVLVTILFARQLQPARESKLKPMVVFILLCMLASELAAGIRMRTLLEPVYIIIRIGLAASLFFLAPRIVRNRDDLEYILKAALLGILVTAGLLISTSIPQLRGVVTRYIFSLEFLEPSSVEQFFLSSETAIRGRSLVGVSILSGAFLNTFWPLTFLLRRSPGLTRFWKLALIASTILTPIAVVLTYSRGAVLGLFFATIAALFINSGKIRRTVILGVGLAALVFSLVGWDSDLFFFERLETTTESFVENPLDEVSEQERIFAYTEPFQHLVENPEFILIGQGFARWKVAGSHLTEGENAATHAVFAAAYYGYGMLAAFAYLALIFQAYRLTWWHIVYANDPKSFSSTYSRALLAGLAGFTSWFILGHAGVSEPRGAMVLFLIFGLAAVQNNFAFVAEEAPGGWEPAAQPRLTGEPWQ